MKSKTAENRYRHKTLHQPRDHDRRRLRQPGGLLGWLLAGMLFMLTAQMPAQASEQPRQLQWVGDVPIMPQLAVEPGMGFTFDSPEGRIVTIFASGAVDAENLHDYYMMALPPLGWRQVARGRFSRDGEILQLAPVEASSGQQLALPLWKISILPSLP